MDLSGTAPVGTSAYQSFSRAGGTAQPLGGAGSFDPIAALDPVSSLRGSSNSQALVSLGYGGAGDSGDSGGNVQAMLAILGGGTPTLDLPASAAALPRGTTGYPGGPPQNPQAAAAQQAVVSIQQFLATSGLNLLA